MEAIKILIVDLGSQYTLVIGRTLGELGFRSIILSPERAGKWLRHNKLRGIILSGGSASVYEESAPIPPKEILDIGGSPILGICYGMQWLVHELGGLITANRRNKEYGAVRIFLDNKDALFLDLKTEGIVWASHGDSVRELPAGFKMIAWPEDSGMPAAIVNQKNKIWGVQFHPEVTHTEQGKDILKRFMKICGCVKDWSPKDIIFDIRNEIAKVAKNKRAIIGFSGGVDSSTLSAIISPIFGSDLQAICINTGALRKDEIKEIRENAKAASVNLKVVGRSLYFQKLLGSTVHAEAKRRRFKKAYGQILEKEAKDFGADYIIQGSLATDIIESGQVGSAALIKSHHNINLNLKVKELHPLRNLFKYEVRLLAEEMKLPESICKRHPFPGPGLFVRVIGMPPRLDKLSIVRWADAKVLSIIKSHGLQKEVSQWIIALECNRTVGVKGDARVYAFTVVVRGLVTADFMTGVGYQIPSNVRREISSVVTKHPKIVRVHFDETNKPPATTELE